jgi:hypothetical protein
MGYFVTLEQTNAYIPSNKLDEAYAIMCELNNHNELKRGCAFPREEKDGPHDGIWFSWMEWNYPETCNDAAAIISELGFTFNEDEEGLKFVHYDNKTGAEDEFIRALAPVLASTDEDAPQFVWRGEDGATWRQIRSEGVMVTQEGVMTFVTK